MEEKIGLGLNRFGNVLTGVDQNYINNTFNYKSAFENHFTRLFNIPVLDLILV